MRLARVSIASQPATRGAVVCTCRYRGREVATYGNGTCCLTLARAMCRAVCRMRSVTTAPTTPTARWTDTPGSHCPRTGTGTAGRAGEGSWGLAGGGAGGRRGGRLEEGMGRGGAPVVTAVGTGGAAVLVPAAEAFLLALPALGVVLCVRSTNILACVVEEACKSTNKWPREVRNSHLPWPRTLAPTPPSPCHCYYVDFSGAKYERRRRQVLTTIKWQHLPFVSFYLTVLFCRVLLLWLKCLLPAHPPLICRWEATERRLTATRSK